MKKWLKKVLIILVILGAAGGLGSIAYNRYRDKIAMFKKGKGEELDLSTPVAVRKVTGGSIRESLVLNGDVVPNAEVNIFSTVPGKVKDIPVQEGDTVNKGTILAYIDRSEAGLTFAPTPVSSTIDGIVKEILVEDGAYVTPQVPLFQIINMDYVEVVLRVPEKDIYRVRKGLGAEVSVVSYPNKTFFGKVDRLSPVVDPVSRTLETRIRINNRNHTLKPGMFGEVHVIIRKKNDAVIIPFSAVINRDGKDVVFIVREEKAVQVDPEFDIREGNIISVVSGLEPGDRVIIIGQHNLNTGDSVKVTEEIE
jgi:multidrug efflux pump subunit AcrA (membrane-fusion protein)